jgi:hypothetical protein
MPATRLLRYWVQAPPGPVRGFAAPLRYAQRCSPPTARSERTRAGMTKVGTLVKKRITKGSMVESLTV